MTISTYKIDSVIKAYNKQNRIRIEQALPQEKEGKRHIEGVSLLAKSLENTDVMTEISRSLFYVIPRRISASLK